MSIFYAQNVNELAQGFGLNKSLNPANLSKPIAVKQNKIQPLAKEIITKESAENVEVTGQKLEKKVESNELEIEQTLIYALIALVLIILSGMFCQLRPPGNIERQLV